MRIGGSLFLIALGAILKFAVTANVNGVDIGTIGVILMIVGAIGLVISLTWMSTRRRTDVIQRGPGGAVGTTYVTPHDTVDGPY
jgi:membrane-bound ClpP family serine protease